MKGRLKHAPFWIAGLLGVFLAVTAVQAREIRKVRQGPAATDQSFVYDYETGKFVRVHHPPPAHYPVGNLKVIVGYDPEFVKVQDAWPQTVQRFLFKRPLEQ